MIEFEDAYDIVTNEFRKFTFAYEEVDLLESTGRILAEDVISDIPMPSFDNSSMDGIAVKYTPGIDRWKIIGESSAGSGLDYKIKESEAVYIATGAKIPGGCDTIIPVEDIEISSDEAILKNRAAYAENNHIRRCGEDLLAGDVVVRRHTLIKQQHVAMAAACGKNRMPVLRQLRMGVFATGNELVEISDAPAGDKIRGSNLYSILAAVKGMGMIPVNLGYLSDNRESIYEFITQVCENDTDVLISTGGISAGKYDFVADAFRDAGVEIRFRGVNIKPGKPMLFGIYERGGKKKLIFALPGNPVSSFVNFILFVRNALFTAIVPGYQSIFYAKVNQDIVKKDNKTHFLRGRITAERGELLVIPTGSQSSANLLGLSDSDCLIVVSGETNVLEKGSTAECIML